MDFDPYTAPPIPPGLDRLFVDISTSCPYELPCLAVFHQSVFTQVSDRDMARFLCAGYRRNGNFLYAMRCPDCAGCVPIRLRVSDFRPNRSQRRVLRANADVDTGMEQVTMSTENLDLLDSFLDARFPDHAATGYEYYRDFFLGSVTCCMEMRYRVGGRLLGTAVVDIGTDWLNAVYFFFDPCESRRSPGTLNILRLVEFCRRRGIEFLYLGYWIPGVRAMSYKSAFRPYELLVNGRWQRFDRRDPQVDPQPCPAP